MSVHAQHEDSLKIENTASTNTGGKYGSGIEVFCASEPISCLNASETFTFTARMSSNNTACHLEPESLPLLCNPILLLTNTLFL